MYGKNRVSPNPEQHRESEGRTLNGEERREEQIRVVCACLWVAGGSVCRQFKIGGEKYVFDQERAVHRVLGGAPLGHHCPSLPVDALQSRALAYQRE